MKLKFIYSITTVFVLLLCGGVALGVSGSVPQVTAQESVKHSDQKITADFFYNPSCESCLKILPFIQQYEANSSLISVHYLNTATDNSSSDRFIELQKSLGHVHVPLVLIGNQYLVGQDNIMNNLESLIKASKNVVITPGLPIKEFSNATQSTESSPGAAQTTAQVPNGILFFYDPSCGSCQEVLPFIQDYVKSHPDTPVEFKDIAANPDNHQQLEQIKKKYPNDTIYVPVVFINDSYLQGKTNITSSFNSTVESYMKSGSLKKPTQPTGTQNTKAVVSPTSSSLNSQPTILTGDNQDLDGIQFFYNPGCPSCMKVYPVVQDYANTHPGAAIIFNDLAAGNVATGKFDKMRGMFPQTTIYAPALLVGKTVLQGETNITNNLNTTIEAYLSERSGNAPGTTRPSDPVGLMLTYFGAGFNTLFGNVKG